MGGGRRGGEGPQEAPQGHPYMDVGTWGRLLCSLVWTQGCGDVSFVTSTWEWRGALEMGWLGMERRYWGRTGMLEVEGRSSGWRGAGGGE